MVGEGKSYLRYSVLVRKEGKQYVSWCPELDVASSGEDIETACKNLEDAVACLLEAYAELGELKQFFAERGISIEEKDHCPSLFLAEARISVPAVS